MTKTVSVLRWLLDIPRRVSELMKNEVKLVGIFITLIGGIFFYESIISLNIFENVFSVLLIILGLFLWDTGSIEQ